MDTPSLEAFKARLDGGPRQPDLLEGVPAYGSGVGTQ